VRKKEFKVDHHTHKIINEEDMQIELSEIQESYLYNHLRI